MAKLQSGKVVASGYAATSAPTGYGASNLALEQLGIPYRSVGVGATDITITFPGVRQVQSLFLHDVNFASATIEKAGAGGTFVGIGVASFYAGTEGRYRGLITVADASVLALKVKVSAGAALDGLGFWRVGAAYPWASAISIPPPFENA